MTAPSNPPSLLAQYLQKTRVTAKPNLPLAAHTLEQPIEASDAQCQVWVHSQLAANVPLYNEPVTVRIEGAVNVTALETAFAEVIRRHEAWRTVLEWRQGNLLQIVLPELRITLPYYDLRSEPEPSRQKRALEMAEADALVPIDPAKPPLFRARVVQMADCQFRLYLTLHHIIFDGVSLYQVFLPELKSCYEALQKGEQPELGSIPKQTLAHMPSPEQTMSERELEIAVKYWEGQLGITLPDTRLPTDHPCPLFRTYAGATHTAILDTESTERLKQVGECHGASLFMTLVAAFSVLLYHLTNRADQVVGAVTSTRKAENIEKAVGFFLNTVPLRLKCQPDWHFATLLASVRNVVLDGLSHELPLSRLLARFAKTRTAGINPLFQIVLSLQVSHPDLGPSWRLTQHDIDTGAAKFDLYVEFEHRDCVLITRFTYSKELFEATTTSRWLYNWTTLLATIAADPNQTLGQLTARLETPVDSAAVDHRRGKNWFRNICRLC